MDKVSVYCLDPLDFRCFYQSKAFFLVYHVVYYNKHDTEKIVYKTSALLRGLQKMAASKPISWPNGINTSLFSLNNNFGTLLTLVLGSFPLDIQP